MVLSYIDLLKKVICLENYVLLNIKLFLQLGQSLPGVNCLIKLDFDVPISFGQNDVYQ